MRHKGLLFLFAGLLSILSSCALFQKSPGGNTADIQVGEDSIYHHVLEERLKSVGTSKGFAGSEPTLNPNKFSLVPVFYASDRLPTGKSDPDHFFSGLPDTSGLHYGQCLVSIPKIHVLGEIDRPSWWKLELPEKPEKHIVLKEVIPNTESGFFSDLHDAALQADLREALVFIHGYNVDFREAAQRTAQIAYDISFKGIPVFYSWPSKGKLLQYAEDGRQNAATVPDLERFLESLAETGSFSRVNIVAHSMGNRALTQALVNLAQKHQNNPLFGQIVMAAPDVDSKSFVEDLAPIIYQTAQSVTLYASSKDKALLLSEKINKQARAGEAGENLVVVDHIQTIDASEIDTDFLGHNYFANTWLLINDLYYLINKGFPAERRNLPSKEKNNFPYWLF